jgi:hypothetical protein
VGAGKLERELGDVDALLVAEFGRGAGGGFDLLGLLEPLREGSIGEEAGRKGARSHDPDLLLQETREEAVSEGGVLEGVLIVREDAVEVVLSVIKDGMKGLRRIAGEPHGTDEALLLELQSGRDGLLPNLGEIDKFDVVEEDDVEMIGAQAVEGDVDAFLDALGGKVEVGERVATEFGSLEIGIAGHVAESDAEQDGDADGFQGILDADFAEFLAEGRGPKAEDGKVDSGVAERSGLHGRRGEGTARTIRR